MLMKFFSIDKCQSSPLVFIAVYHECNTMNPLSCWWTCRLLLTGTKLLPEKWYSVLSLIPHARTYVNKKRHYKKIPSGPVFHSPQQPPTSTTSPLLSSHSAVLLRQPLADRPPVQSGKQFTYLNQHEGAHSLQSQRQGAGEGRIYSKSRKLSPYVFFIPLVFKLVFS